MFSQNKIRSRAESAMAERKGITWRREIGRRIADGVDRALPVARKHIETALVFKHTVARIDLPEKDPPALPFATNLGAAVPSTQTSPVKWREPSSSGYCG